MKRKYMMILGIVGVLAILLFVKDVHARTIYVGPEGEYTSIQDAIDNATDGDTIIVEDGIYFEHIKVTKSLKIKSRNGPENCIIDGGEEGTVITVKADGVTIEGFTIRHSGSDISSLDYYAGIRIRSDNNNIMHNKILMCDRGIYIGGYGWRGDNNNISHNDIYLNKYEGIYVEGSNNNILYNNISNNRGHGIQICCGSKNIITYNRISDNSNHGILLSSSSKTIVKNNRIFRDGIFITGGWRSHYTTHTIENNTVNGRPIYYFKGERGKKAPEDAGQIILVDCSDITIENLNISDTDTGIAVACSSYISIRNCNISNNNRGAIHIKYSDNITITDSEVLNNKGCGIKFYVSHHIDISHNNLSGNKGSGIIADTGWKSTIAHNYISSNGRNGIYIDYCSEIKVMYNKISKNGGTGIKFTFDNDKSRIIYNTISDNSHGIYLAGRYNYVAKNNFIRNGKQASFYYPKGPCINIWYRNYWSNWKINLPKPIFGMKNIIEPSETAAISIEISWLDFDWLPATRPYNIGC